MRDSLTHPSPYRDPKTLQPEKIRVIAGVNPEDARQLLRATINYVQTVEAALGRDPKKAMHYLSRLDV